LNSFHICQLITQGSTNGQKLQKEECTGIPTCHLHDILKRSQRREIEIGRHVEISFKEVSRQRRKNRGMIPGEDIIQMKGERVIRGLETHKYMKGI